MKITVELNYRDDSKAVATVHGHPDAIAYVTDRNPRGGFYLCDNTRRQGSGKHWAKRLRHSYEVISAWLAWVGIESDYRNVTIIETGVRATSCNARVMHDAIGYGCVKSGPHTVHETSLALRWYSEEKRLFNCQERSYGYCVSVAYDLVPRHI